MAQNSSKIYQNFWIALSRNSEVLMHLFLAVLSSFYGETFLKMSHQQYDVSLSLWVKWDIKAVFLSKAGKIIRQPHVCHNLFSIQFG